MSRFTGLIYLLGVAVLLSGCNKKEEKSEESAAVAPAELGDLVAVIDLNIVAQEIGAQAKIDVSLKQKEQELMGRFNGLKAELGRKVTSLTGSGVDLNDQQQNELDRINAENENALTLQAQAAQSQLVAHHSRLKQQLLAEIRPVAYKVAREKGMQIVLTVGQVYAAGPNVNITQDVVKHIKEMNEKNASIGTDTAEPKRYAELPGGGEFTPR